MKLQMNYGKDKDFIINIWKIWKWLTKVVVPNPKKFKINPKIIDNVFISHVNKSNAWWFLVYKSNILDINKNIIIESRNASIF